MRLNLFVKLSYESITIEIYVKISFISIFSSLLWVFKHDVSDTLILPALQLKK